MGQDNRSDDAGNELSVAAPLKGPLRVREARQRIAELEQVIRDGEASGTAMCDAFIEQFPRAPAKLARSYDKSLTFYRWRQSGARHWGGSKTTAISLTGDTGLQLLSRVPEAARPKWLNYERRRIYLNLQLTLATYQLYRLQEWLDGLDTIRVLETEGVEAVMARRNPSDG